jgi:hypothetical protein
LKESQVQDTYTQIAFRNKAGCEIPLDKLPFEREPGARYLYTNCLLKESRAQDTYTVKTPDVDFCIYNQMPQDQTVHGAKNVSHL